MKTKSIVAGLMVWALAMFLAGCNRGNQQTADQSAEQPAGQSAETPAKEGSAKAGKLKHRPAAAGSTAATAAPKPEPITIPEGTPLEVRLASGIDSGHAAAGSPFEATLAAPLTVNGADVAPTGSKVTGQVTNAVSSGRLNRPAELSLTLTSLAPEGGSPVQISTSTWSAKGQSHKKRDAELIGGGAGVGALIGALAGKGKGAAIGAAVGAGGGTAGAAITGKKEIVLAPEAKLTFRLTAPVTLSR
ncbi:MAG TPA: hypothetical protein VG204_20430 [Terriglobia bacterium]|nr:hypothetical protein [Terriglobia bacterium]